MYTIPPGPPYSPIEKLILPFETYVWLWIVICTGMALVTITCVSSCGSKNSRNFVFGAKNRTPFLNYINIMLGGAITSAPIRNFARTIFLIWLLGSLILRSSYTGAIFSFIQSQKSAIEIRNLEQLIKYNFTIYSSMQMLRLLEFGYPHLSKKYLDFVCACVFNFTAFEIICLFSFLFSLKLHDGSYDIMEALKSNFYSCKKNT